MSKYKIAVICEANPANNPRPNRIIEAFKNEFEITAIGREASAIEGVEVLSYNAPQKRNFLQELHLYINIFTQNFHSLIFIPTRQKIADYLSERNFEIIFCHDLILLPIVLENKKSAKVIVDLREYYPRQHESSFRWRLLFAKFNKWMCCEFLKKADYLYTVSEGIAHEYQKNFGVKCDVVMSLPRVQCNTSDLKIVSRGGGARPYQKKFHSYIMAWQMQIEELKQ